MSLHVAIDKRELKAVLIIWLVLLTLAIASLLVLYTNAHRIIYHLEYVAVNRYQKAIALYTEAERRTSAVLKKRQQSAVPIPAGDEDYTAALELYQKAFATDPREDFVPEQERYYTMLGDTQGATGQQLQQLVAYARAALSRKDLATAAQDTSRALSLKPDDSDARFVDAQLAYASGDKTAAQERLHRIPAGQWGPAMHELSGQLLLEQNKPADAAEEFQKALTSGETSVDVRKKLAAAYSRLGRSDEAIKVLQQGRTQGGDSDGNYLHILGDLLLSSKLAGEAVKVLEQAAHVEPNSGAVQLSLARAYQDTGQSRRAARAMQRATALDPSLQTALLKQP